MGKVQRLAGFMARRDVTTWGHGIGVDIAPRPQTGVNRLVWYLFEQLSRQGTLLQYNSR